MTNELTILTWAHANRNEEPVASFWGALCDRLGFMPAASPRAVLAELERDGGNTLVNIFRGEGVGYTELAYDVADKLSGFFEDQPFSERDVVACERFVLGKMEVSEDDLKRLCDSVRGGGLRHSVSDQVRKGVAKGVAETAAFEAARRASCRWH